MEMTRICDMGLSPTPMDGQDKYDPQESLSVWEEIVKNCSGPCNS